MKRTRRVIALLLTLVMLLSVGGGAWAFEPLTPETPAETEGPTALPPEEAEGELAEAENMDFCRPTDGVTPTATASVTKADGTTEENDYESPYVPSKVFGANYGWDYAGGTKNTGGRWLSKNYKGATHVLTIDLGAVRQVSSLHLYWFNNNFTGLKVEVSASASGDSDWVTVRDQNSRVLSLLQRLSFDKQNVRRIRMSMKNADDQGFSTDADNYFDVSLYRVEAYETAPAVDTSVTATTPADDVNMVKISRFGHMNDDAKGSNCSTGPSEADSSIYIRASASSWVTSADESKHPQNTNRAGMAFDGNESTGWKAVAGNGTEQPWIIVNLGTNRNIKGIKLNFGSTNIRGYKLEGTTNPQGESWHNLKTVTDNTEQNIAANLDVAEPVSFVRLTITDYDTSVSPNVVVNEMKIYANNQVADETPDPSDDTTPDGNLCRPSDGVTVTATASSEEATSVQASNAIDGNTTSNASRWGSAVGNGPHSLQIDLGVQRSVSLVKIFWERRNVLAYTLQGSADGEAWKTLHTCTSEITTCNEELTFEPVNIRYLKLNITSHKDTGTKWDGTESDKWNTVSLFEVEAYRDAKSIPVNAASILASLGSSPLTVSSGHVVFTAEAQAVVDAHKATHTVTFAADYEQLVGPDGTIYQPLVDTTARFDITVQNKTDDADKATTSAQNPIALTIPGANKANAGNPKPAVIPELMEWYSSAAQKDQKFTLTSSSRIVAPSTLTDVANEVKADIQDLFGYELSVVTSGEKAGDIVLVMGTGAAVTGFDDETYTMDVTDKVVITGSHATGVYWGTRSALQALKMSGDKTIAQGKAKDYPKFRVRGYVMDVGRKPQSMDMLEKIVKNMAWYKLNDFHVHLSDNLIFIEDYGYTSNSCTQEQYEAGNAAYGAFRLESSLKEEEGATPLAAKDYHYTKAEFKQFVTDSAALGVKIVPELDVPAHAKPIVDAFPSLRQPAWFDNHALNDHFNLAGKYDESLAKVEEIFNDYLDGSDPVFTSGIVHFGADEYYPNSTLYRKFHKDMIAYLKGKGQTVRTWGSLSRMSSSDPDAQYTKEETAKVQMNIWNTGWADPQTMYDMGFDLINVTDGPSYMVPNGSGGRGGYGDYLDPSAIYNWVPNHIGTTWFPASSSQILGSAYAIWMDNIDTRAAGMDEQDTFDRFFDTLPIISVRQWGEGGDGLDRTLAELQEDIKQTGYAPQGSPVEEIENVQGANAYAQYEFTSGVSDTSGNSRDLTLHSAVVENKALTVSGNSSYAETGLNKLPWGSKLSFWVRVDEPGILFESDVAYDENTLRALPVEGDATKWKLGFGRELHDYTFDHEFAIGEWVKITLVNDKQAAKLYVEGSDAAIPATGAFLPDENSNTQFKGKTGITNSSFCTPVARIGSKTEAFVGAMDDVFIAPSDANMSSPASSGKYDLPTAGMTATAGTQQATTGNEGPASNLLDGDAATIWHSKYSSPAATLPDFWVSVDMGSAKEVSALRYLPRSTGNNGTITKYKIEASTDGTSWTTVVESGTFAGSSDWQTATFDKVTARYIRLTALATLPSNNFASGAELRLCRPVNLQSDGGTVSFAEASYPLVGGSATPDPIVVVEGVTLTKGTDYTVTYSNNTTEGTGTATITGAGAYTGTVTATFTISGTEAPPVIPSLADAEVTLPQTAYTHTGSAITPVPTVTLDGSTLAAGKDFTVTYANNVNVGTASLTVTGQGDYTGEKTISFQIIEAASQTIDLSSATVTLPQTSYTHTGSAIEPVPTVVLNGKTLTQGTDYTVSYSRNVSVGTATVTVTGILNYTGTATATFEITEATGTEIDLSSATVTLPKTSYTHTGSAITPEPTVTLNGATLTKGTDYTVSYQGNVNVGTATVTITGMGDYTGTASVTFKITSSGGTTPGGNTGGTKPSGSTGGGTPTVPTEPVTTTVTDPVTGATTEKTVNPDGSTYEKVTLKNGTVTETTVAADGTKTQRVEAATGSVMKTVTEPSGRTIQSVDAPNRGLTITVTSPLGEVDVAVSIPDVPAEITNDYVDVPDGHWSEEAVNTVSSLGLFKGDDQGRFQGEVAMSRGMVATVLHRLSGEVSKMPVGFVDVADDAYYAPALDWAASIQVIQGVGQGKCDPDRAVTRQELCAMLYRYTQFIGAEGKAIAHGSIGDFEDSGEVAGWATNAMDWAITNGILQGRGGALLAPDAPASRAEVAAIFTRLVELIRP